MSGLLEGKIGLVTGGASGIGKATVLAMVREGAAVVIADLAQAAGQALVREIEAAGGRALYVPVDVSRDVDVQAMVQLTVEHFGRLDCVLNNAGIAVHNAGGTPAPIGETDEAIWNRVVAVNLTGVFLCLKRELAQMQGQGGGGSIVNLASIAGLIGLPSSAPYVATKHGVIGLTRTAALDYADAGIRVNAVCPGYIRTPLNNGLFGDEERPMTERGAAILARVPQRRLGEAEEIAEMVVWLLGDRASYATGGVFTVDGGRTIA